MERGNKLIILMYHGIISGSSAIMDQRETGAEIYDVSLDNFQAQMKWLKEHAYTVSLVANQELNSSQKAVVITFDDGEMNNFKEAYPVLKEFNWKAYFFIIVKRIGTPGYMGWEELKKLNGEGMIIGSHGLSHEVLTNLTDSQMEEELEGSKRNLEINLGRTIDSISIPRGFCNDKVIKKAYEVGYKTIFISDRPQMLQSKCLSRTAIKSNWSLQRFNAALLGQIPLRELLGNTIKNILKTIFRESGYNWIRHILIKLFK